MEMENFKLQCAACGKLGTGSHGAFRGTSRPIPKTLRIDIGSPRREDGALNERICPACRERNRTIIKRSEEHTSELQSLMRSSYAVFCLKKKQKHVTVLLILTDNTTTCHNNIV